MIERDGYLRGVGDRHIFWRSWTPDGSVAALVVLVHGAGEHCGRYEHVADRLVGEGHAVYALDHRGHGRSDGPRALIDRMAFAVEDLDALVHAAGDVHPGAPMFLLGHSLGGLITLRYLLAHGDRVHGAMLSGTLATVDASPALRAAGHALSVLAPRLPLIGVDPALVSRDPAVVAAYEADPLVHHGKLPARTCAEITDAADPLGDAVRTITVPTFVMFGTADGLCDPQGSIMLGDRLGSTDVTVRAYEGLYHEILNEPEQDTVLNDVCGWLGAHVAAAALV